MDRIVISDDELAFFKANLEDLSPTFLRKLKWDIIAEKKRRRGAEASAKTQGSGKQHTGQSSERQPGSDGGGGRLRATKRQAEPSRASAKPMS
jgi:hypothetical protein